MTRRVIALLAFVLLLAATVMIPSAVVRHYREQSRRSNLFSRWAATAPSVPKIGLAYQGGRTISRPVAFGRDTLFVVEPYTPAAQLVQTTPRAPNVPGGMAGVGMGAPLTPGTLNRSAAADALLAAAQTRRLTAAEISAVLALRAAQMASSQAQTGVPGATVPGPINPPTFAGAPAPTAGVRIPLSGFATTDPLVQDGAAWLGLDNQRIAAFDVWTGKTLWSARIGRRAEHITRSGERLFVAAEDHATALDVASGTILWGQSLGRLVTSAVAVSGDRACFGTADDLLQIVDARTGDGITTLPLGRAAFGKPAVDDDQGVAYFASGYAVRDGPRGIHAVDVARGTIRWKHDIAESPSPQGRQEIRGPAVADDLILFTAGNTLHALDRTTGARRWEWSTNATALSTPVPHRGAIFIACPHAVFAVDAQSGKQVWVLPTSPGQWSHRMADDYAPVIHRDVLYHVPDAGSVLSVQLPRGAAPRRASVTTTVAVSITKRIYAAAGGILIFALALIFGLGLRRLVIAVACAAFAAVITWAWIDSYNVTHFAGKRIFATPAGGTNAEHAHGVTSRRGTVTFGASHIVWDSALTRPMPTNPSGGLCVTLVPIEDDPIVLEAHSSADDADLGLSRFAATRRSRPSGTTLGPQAESSITVPHWFLIATLSVAPLAWATGLWRDRKRYPKGHCPTCGYDLRASPQRCPECGWGQKKEVATDEMQMKSDED
jgi:outer membrane protein assembly factor BamB